MKIIIILSLLNSSILIFGQTGHHEINIDSNIVFVPGMESFEKQLEDFKGSVIYVDFWATFCGPCIKQFKYKKALDIFFEENGIIPLCICVDKENKKEKWKNIIQKDTVHGYHVFINSTSMEEYKSGIKVSSKIHRLMGRGFPHFLIINKNGDIVEEYAILPEKKKELMKQLDKYLK